MLSYSTLLYSCVHLFNKSSLSVYARSVFKSREIWWFSGAGNNLVLIKHIVQKYGTIQNSRARNPIHVMLRLDFILKGIQSHQSGLRGE